MLNKGHVIKQFFYKKIKYQKLKNVYNFFLSSIQNQNCKTTRINLRCNYHK